MRLRVQLVLWMATALLFVVNISSPVMVSAQTDSCAGSLAPRLTVGGYGRVTPGNSNNVRDTANKAGTLVGKLPGGESFEVVDGPKCADDLYWWQIRTSDFEGWTVESDKTSYWLVPYVPSFKVTTQNKVTHVQYVEARKISFDFDSSLAQGVRYDFAIADWNSQSSLPESVCFNFRVDPPQDFPYNHLCVINTTGMDGYVDALNRVLTDQPAFNGRRTIPIPFNGAAQLIQAQQHYFETDTLRGVSFVTSYAQDDFPVTNDGLEYNYSGLSKDGKVILFFAYRTTSTVLAHEKATMALVAKVRANPFAYYKSVVDRLSPASHADFTPNLDTLDALIQSISFN